MGSSIPSNWQSGVYKRDKRHPHFLFPSRIAQKVLNAADAPTESGSRKSRDSHRPLMSWYGDKE